MTRFGIFVNSSCDAVISAIAEGKLDGTSDQRITAERSTTTGTPADTVQRHKLQFFGHVHRNTKRKSR